MAQIMRRPRRQQLRKCYGTEHLVASTLVQVRGLEIQCAYCRDILPSQLGEFIQQLRQRLALAVIKLRQAVELVEGDTFAMFQQAGCTRHPIRLLTVDEMSHDVISAPGIAAFVRFSPNFGQVAKQSVQRGRKTLE